MRRSRTARSGEGDSESLDADSSPLAANPPRAIADAKK